MPGGGELNLNRNVTIVIVILVLVVIAGYLVWLRSKYQAPVTPKVEEQVQVTSTPLPQVSASPSARSDESETRRATPGAKEATGSVTQKSPTPKPTVKPIPTASPVGQ